MNTLRDSVAQLAAAFVRSPSQAGVDVIDGVVEVATQWLTKHRMQFECLKECGAVHGILIRIPGINGNGRRLLLNACLDTAGFGDIARWQLPPTSGISEDDWLYGRGSADSKMGAALFLHLAAHFWGSRTFSGELILFLDGDEHTGSMKGMRAFQGLGIPVDFAMIGYPGRDKVMIGARGFLRVHVKVFGLSSHSGAKSVSKQNAVTKAARLVAALSRDEIVPVQNAQTLNPKITVTAIHGGEGFALVPDECTVSVDCRLIEDFQADAALEVMAKEVVALDAVMPTGKPSEILRVNHLPAYRLNAGHPLSRGLLSAARSEFGAEVVADVCGPSNIGNLLALDRIPATCGFGVRYQNIHAPNECAFLPDIEPVYRAYRQAIAELLGYKGVEPLPN